MKIINNMLRFNVISTLVFLLCSSVAVAEITISVKGVNYFHASYNNEHQMSYGNGSDNYIQATILVLNNDGLIAKSDWHKTRHSLSVKFIYSDRIEKLDSSKYSLLAFTTFSDDHKATKFTVFIKKPPNHNVKAVEIYGEYSCTTSQKLVSKTIKNVELKTGTKLDVGITTASIERASDTDLVFHSDQKFRLINKVELYYPQGILLTGKDGGSSYSQNKLRQWYKFGSIPKMADLNFEYFKDTNSAKIPFKLLINSPI